MVFRDIQIQITWWGQRDSPGDRFRARETDEGVTEVITCRIIIKPRVRVYKAGIRDSLGQVSRINLSSMTPQTSVSPLRLAISHSILQISTWSWALWKDLVKHYKLHIKIWPIFEKEVNSLFSSHIWPSNAHISISPSVLVVWSWS